MRRFVPLALAALTLATVGGAPATAAPPAHRMTLDYVQGVGNPEDLVSVPGTDTVIASGMSADPQSDSASSGHLYAIDAAARHPVEVWPEGAHDTAWDQRTYPDCPGPPDETRASPHGINIAAGPGGGATLYVVNHGGRESVEVFDVRPGNDATDLKLTWKGCVVTPPGTYPNGVAPVPGTHDLVVTNFFDPAAPDPFEAMFKGEPTGDVLRWSPRQGWRTLPGSRLAGPNGVEVSRDGRWAFVAAWGNREVHRIPLQDHPRPTARRSAVQFPFMPDNLRWGRDGRLLVTGQDLTYTEFQSCQAGDLPRCPDAGFDIYSLAPHSMRSRLTYGTGTRDFGMATVANPVGDEIWLGSVRGTRIARLHSS
ncbi:SMP-30/gluconolactonase/LRE family protein [Streptomyces sp. BH106]|uniref:SMP-30/gluconolactonase/LRE family protein n=1 Tax=Streptomyces sp. BH106 TaxID=3410409 RepID=UPI003CE84F77